MKVDVCQFTPKVQGTEIIDSYGLVKLVHAPLHVNWKNVIEVRQTIVYQSTPHCLLNASKILGFVFQPLSRLIL